MKKIFVIVMAVLPLFFASCAGNDEKAAAVADSLQSVIDQKDVEIDALFEVLDRADSNDDDFYTTYRFADCSLRLGYASYDI